MWSKQLFNLPRCFEIRNFWFKFQPTLHWCTTYLPARIPFHTMIYPYRMIKTHRLKQIDMHMCQMFNYYIEICIVYIYIYTIMSYPYNYCGSPSTLSLSPSDKSSSYHQLSWSLEAMRYGLTMVDLTLKFNRHLCRGACQISEQYSQFHTQSCSFKTLWDPVVRCLTT